MDTKKTEILAGVTTFLTMGYIIAVNPAILSTEGTGMSFTGVLTATVIISFLSTLLMGLVAKLPYALAPGMGINAFFTFTLILGEGMSWQQALGMTFWSGIFFLIISITPLRVMIVNAIPPHLRFALTCGIGIFLSFIGFKNAMILESNPVTFIQSAHFSAELCCALFGLVITVFLLLKKNPASFLMGIVSTTLLAFLIGKVHVPESLISAPDFDSVFFKLDIMGSLKIAYIPAIISLIATDLFDSLASFIGVANASGLVDENGEPKNVKKALLVDAIATTLSGIFGTSAATTYIESSAGALVGGKTGLTAIVTACCFLPFLFLAPLVAMVPTYATAPVLIIVGFMMFKNITRINFVKLEEAIPAFLMILLIPLSFSITQGVLWGLITHVILYTLAGRHKELSPFAIGLGVMSGALLYTH